MNHFKEENKIVEDQFDLNEVLQFTLEHEVQIVRGDDYQYMACIDRKYYTAALTPMYALWFGIQQYKSTQLKISEKL